MFIVRLVAAGAGLALLAATCADDGDDGGATSSSATSSSSITTPAVQERFHPEFLESLHLSFDTMIPERFAPDAKGTQIVDVTKGEVEFKTQRELGEFAREQGLLGFGVADFSVSDGSEYWGLVTWVFQTADGARAVFERFPDPERVTVSDATKTATDAEPYAEGRLGNLSVETYVAPDGVTTLFLRGSLVDGNALFYVSAIVDVAPGEGISGVTQIRGVMRSLDGLYPAIFRKFLELGGTDEATTTTTRDPSFVPEGEIPGGGESDARR